jgi:hypothetical protein
MRKPKEAEGSATNERSVIVTERNAKPFVFQLRKEYSLRETSHRFKSPNALNLA